MKKILLLFLAIMVYGGMLMAQDTTGLLAYYPFNGNANDSSGNNHNGSVYGAVLTTDRFGHNNRAYSFDGSSYIVVDSFNTLPVGSQPRTLSFWANAVTSQATQCENMVGYGGSGFYRDAFAVESLTDPSPGYTGRGIVFDFEGGYYATDSLLGPIWKFIAGVYDDANQKFSIYINGVKIRQDTLTLNTLMTYGPQLNIGRLQVYGGSYARFFHGKIDEVRLYGGALDSAQIDSLYHENGWGIQANIISDLSDQVVCLNDDGVFKVWTNGIPPIIYQWQKDGVDISGATDSILVFQQIQPSDAGGYRCIASNSYGTDTSNTAILTVEFAVPTIINGLQNVIEYQEVLYSVPMQPGHINEFLVEGGNEIQSAENTLLVQWGSHGMGYVKLIETSELGCIADTVTLDVSIGHLGVNDLLERIEFKAIPNPFNSSTTFSYVLAETGQVVIRIYNSFGQIVAEPLNSKQTKGMQNVDWYAGNLPAGIYYYRIQVGEMEGTGKVVKW